MGMPRQRQRHALRHAREDVGFVRHQDRRRIVRDLGERAGEIVDADLAPAGDMEGELVAEPEKPERAAVLDQPRGIVLEQRDVGVGEDPMRDRRPAALLLGPRIVPPFVIAEDRIAAERRLERHERRHDLRPIRPDAEQPIGVGIVAEEEDQVGLERIRDLDDAAHPRHRHRRHPGVEIGEDDEPEAKARRPAGRRQA